MRQQALDLRNAIWSILQAEGLKPPKLARSEFQTLVERALEYAELHPLLQPLIVIIERLERKIDASTAASPPAPRRAPPVGV